MRDPEVNENYSDPMDDRVPNQHAKVSPGANSLQAVAESFEQHGKFFAPARSPFWILQSSSEPRGAVIPKINQERNGRQEAAEKNNARGARHQHRSADGPLPLKQNQCARGEHGGG